MQVVTPTPAAVYTGMSNAIATISRVEGIRSLWKGISSVIIGAGIMHRYAITKPLKIDVYDQVLRTPSILRHTKR